MHLVWSLQVRRGHCGWHAHLLVHEFLARSRAPKQWCKPVPAVWRPTREKVPRLRIWRGVQDRAQGRERGTCLQLRITTVVAFEHGFGQLRWELFRVASVPWWDNWLGVIRLPGCDLVVWGGWQRWTWANSRACDRSFHRFRREYLSRLRQSPRLWQPRWTSHERWGPSLVH